MGWIHIPLGRRTILIWFWFLVPCFYVEVMATNEWRKKIGENPGRHWRFSRRWPLISIRNISVEEMYPQVMYRIMTLDVRRHSTILTGYHETRTQTLLGGFPGIWMARCTEKVTHFTTLIFPFLTSKLVGGSFY